MCGEGSKGAGLALAAGLPLRCVKLRAPVPWRTDLPARRPPPALPQICAKYGYPNSQVTVLMPSRILVTVPGVKSVDQISEWLARLAGWLSCAAWHRVLPGPLRPAVRLRPCSSTRFLANRRPVYL